MEERVYPTTLRIFFGDIYATDIRASGDTDAKRKASRWANGIEQTHKGRYTPNPRSSWKQEGNFLVKRWNSAELSIKKGGANIC